MSKLDPIFYLQTSGVLSQPKLGYLIVVRFKLDRYFKYGVIPHL